MILGLILLNIVRNIDILRICRISEILKFIFLAHSVGKQLPAEILNRLHLVLWDRAAKNYEVSPLTTSEQSQHILFKVCRYYLKVAIQDY